MSFTKTIILTNKQVSNSDVWFVIVNPNAGRKKGEKDWNEIKDLFQKSEILINSIFTKAQGHAIELVKKAIEDGFRKFIIVGGDGTLNEAINGILSQKIIPSSEIIIGMIPVGTGNDWGRMYQIPCDYQAAVELIKTGTTFIQDAGKVSYWDKEGQSQRYFVNMAGMGYDALVAKKTNIMKAKGGGGPFAYLINMFLGLIQYKFTFLELSIDGKEVYKGKVFSMNIGICKYNGGGMMQLPYAEPDNGLFDITLIKKASKLKVITNIKNLYDGSFIKMPEVETFKGKQIKLLSKPKNTIFLEADGESLGYSPMEFEIIPKSIKLLRG